MNKYKTLKEKNKDDLEEAARRFAVRVSADVQKIIRHKNDPVARQYLPDSRELVISRQERDDPIGDNAHSPVKGIVHRHQDRVLFKVSSVCAVNCRFCFRKNMLGTPEHTLDQKEIDKALTYIKENKTIREVILTGGDPLILSPRRLAQILQTLDNIDHVDIIRIHSRTPIAAPTKMSDAHYELFSKSTKPVYMVLHVNHVQEISPAVKQTLSALHRTGVVLLSQSVLLKNVNDTADALQTLFRELLKLRVKPYYLHHPDLVPGTSHFRISIEVGQKIMRELRASTTGLALPTYVLDIPGGHGKVPLEQASIRSQGNKYIVTDHEGVDHIYP